MNKNIWIITLPNNEEWYPISIEPEKKIQNEIAWLHLLDLQFFDSLTAGIVVN